MSQDNPSISFLIATIGRPSLKATLASLIPQIVIGHDHIYCVFDGICQNISLVDEINNLGDSLKLILHPENLGNYGHGLRNFYQGRLEGDYIHHMDDDDLYLPDTIPQVRNEIKANLGKIIICKFYGLDGLVVGRERLISMGQIGTPSGFLPNEPSKFATWPLWYGGDSEFYEKTCKNFRYVFTDILLIKTQR
jgi:hypothetical protein